MDSNRLPYENKPDGILFHLRDDAKMLLKWTTSTKVVVEMWRGEALMPPDTGNLNSANFREKLARSAKVAFAKDGKDSVPNILDDIGMVALAMSSPIGGEEDDEDKRKTLWDLLAQEMGPVDWMIKYAKEGGQYFHTPEMEGYATVKIERGHQETYPLYSRNFKLWLRRVFHRREKLRLDNEDDENDKDLVFPHRALADVVAHMESIALFEGHEEQVYVRIARHSGMIYVDLCDRAWRAVEISANGWRVIPSDDVPVKFIRSRGMLPIPEPVEDEDALPKLRSLLNIADSTDGERNWRLILAWLVQAFTPTGPYPVLTLLGPQGAAKSTAQRILRNIVDPSTVPLRTAPRDEHNLYIDARAGWVIALDNMSSLPMWLSDALARLASGGGFSTRQLYTDQDQILFEAMRPVILNGIGDVITRPDLLDRSLIINLPPIPKEARKLERVLEAEVEEAKAGILAALFSAISSGLATQEHVKLDGLPRMADFARWGTATERALGGEEASFLDAYTASQEDAVETALESWPIVEVLVAFARNHQGEDSAWIGTATELFNTLNERAEDDLKRSKDWPKQPNKLSEQISRLAPSLVEVRVHVERLPGHKQGRKLKVFAAESRK